MDGSRFDDLTRALAAPASRRRLLRRMVGSATAGAAALLGIDRATAEPRRCPLGQSCGELCCPPENVGCISPKKLPEGTIVPARCICPSGTRYDSVQHACVPCVTAGGACKEDEECCRSEHVAGSCVEGTCHCCNTPKGAIKCFDGSTERPDDAFCCEAPLLSGACCTEHQTSIDCPCFWLCYSLPDDPAGWRDICPEGTWLIGAFGWQEACDR